ncbi:probable amidase At4g34880 [Malania oleifera]|uniref:probable amidase At4g34880 n=1 Tax=Malania oleifera TaxID=397392 RepID=UPI0025AE0FB8|nr:probable amidase At4g34880 [Malania oleifera]
MFYLWFSTLSICNRMRLIERRCSAVASILSLLLLLFSPLLNPIVAQQFAIEEATVSDIQRAFAENELTSRQLVEFYLQRIETLNPLLRGVVEVNPDALDQADEADRERGSNDDCRGPLGGLHGVPVLLKDSIATKDRLNNTAGSYALLGAEVARDAGVVERLRRAGAVILGKASLTEWYGLRCWGSMPSGWSARVGQGLNPYVQSADPCGSSSGSAISVAANMAAVSLGTETDGSIICPADHNSVVGLKPTVGLTSRAGVLQVSPSQDTIGPICRTVSDAVYVLDAIVGFDPRDSDATGEAAKFIPAGGYKQFLNEDGLKGKRLGVVRDPFFDSFNGSSAVSTFEHHLKTLSKEGATLVNNLEITNIEVILDPYQSGEAIALLADFKLGIAEYLKGLINSPVRSLADIIAFNLKNTDLEKIREFGQGTFIEMETTSVSEEEVREAVERMKNLSRDGFEKMMVQNELDAMVTLGVGASPVLALGGYPAITVPAGYDSTGMPFGICFGGLKGTEPRLIEIAYAFEQATMTRRPPFLESFKLMNDH